MRRNLALNIPYSKRISLNAVGLSDTDGTSKLYVPTPTAEVVETSASMDGQFKSSIDSVIDVPTQRLDTWWKSHGLPAVGVLKIDTEGTEHAVLAGAVELIRRERPVVVYELLPRAHTDEIATLAAEFGYSDMRLRPTAVVSGQPIEFDPEAWNHILVPSGGRATVEAIALKLGLAWVA